MRSSSVRISRRQLGGLAAGVSVSLLVGCSTGGDGDPSDADLLTWLNQLNGVARAEYVPNDSDTTGHSARITTTPQLSDTDVRALTAELAKGYDKHAPRGRPSLQLQVDRFLFPGRTGPLGNRVLELERALWLRSDGRAISADGIGGRFTIITRPGTVADVALGFDAVSGDKGRATHEVRSEDGWTALSWSDYVDQGWALDRPMVQRIADLGHRYPGLQWWARVDPTEIKAGLFFAADDISLDELIADADRLVRRADFAELELGWGPARAPYELFAPAFATGKIRAVLDAVADVPGVAELRVSERTGGKGPDLDELVVRTAAGYRAGLAALRGTWNDYVSVSLVREPARYIGQRPTEVFRGSIFDSALRVRVQAALADLDQVLQYAIGPTFANLTLALDVSDGQLTSALTTLTERVDRGPDPEAESSGPYAINVYARDGEDLQTLGQATPGTFRRSTEITPSGTELAARVQTVWERLT